MSLLDLDNKVIDLDFIKSLGFNPLLVLSDCKLYDKRLSINNFDIGFFYYNTETQELEFVVYFTSVLEDFDQIVKKIQPHDVGDIIVFIENMTEISKNAIKRMLKH
jgi:hypothetical protein